MNFRTYLNNITGFFSKPSYLTRITSFFSTPTYRTRIKRFFSKPAYLNRVTRFFSNPFFSSSIYLDENGAVLNWNRNFRKSRMFPEKEILGKFFSILYSGDLSHKAFFQEQLNTARQKGYVKIMLKSPNFPKGLDNLKL